MNLPTSLICFVIAGAFFSSCFAQAPRDAQENAAVRPFAGDKAGEMRNDNRLRLPLIWCPPGAFMLGSPQDDSQADRNEKPQVHVELTRGFWIGKYEITQAQWTAMMGSKPWTGKKHEPPNDDSPAVYLSWKDATEFCRRLTESERNAGRLSDNVAYRLPSEAQWEYACRAGTTTRYCFGNDPAELGKFAWYDKNTFYVGKRYAHPVGTKEANAWGLHDMHGNAYEFCSDWYSRRPQGGIDPISNRFNGRIVLRSGSWFFHGEICRTALRDQLLPHEVDYDVGFRIALIDLTQDN